MDLVPAFVKTHGHSADKRLDSSSALIVGGPESAAHVLVVQNLHLEREIFFQVFYDHDQEGQLNSQRLIRVCRACNVIRSHVGSHDFDDRALNIWVR